MTKSVNESLTKSVHESLTKSEHLVRFQKVGIRLTWKYSQWLLCNAVRSIPLGQTESVCVSDALYGEPISAVRLPIRAPWAEIIDLEKIDPCLLFYHPFGFVVTQLKKMFLVARTNQICDSTITIEKKVCFPL